MTSVLEKYLQQIRDATSKPGVYAYRGQSRAEWALHSAATRRLSKSLGNNILNVPDFSKVYIDYHRQTLLDAARTRGFGVESGRDISNLQLLSKLQHFGAATGLLDFTWSPLIALWFASRESNFDGKLFVLNVNDPIQVAKVTSDLEDQTIDALFSRPGNAPGLLYWEPMWSGDAMPRILRQRGVFIIGRPLIPIDSQIIGEVKILESDKASLLDELSLLDISESSLFPDIYGFSSSEGPSTSTRVSTPRFYFVQGNQHYQAGNYVEAIAAYDNCINLSSGVAELYLLRGNAKSEAKLYHEAVDDYKLAVIHKDKAVLGLGTIENTVISDLMLFMAYFNCGNALAELPEYESALRSYSEAIQIDRNEILNRGQAFFNRGNVYQDLRRFEEAIGDYDAAMSLRASSANSHDILFNKGNALVKGGRLEEALGCYKLAEEGETSAETASHNREALGRVVSAIGPRDFQCQFDMYPNIPFGRLVVQVAGVGNKVVPELFKGRVGNTGNFGWHGVSGKGFGGNLGFILEVVGKEKDDAPTIAPSGS